MLLDHVHLYTDAHTTKGLHQLNFQVFKHPHYSPHLVPYFTSDQEVNEAVHECLVTRPIFFLDIQKEACGPLD
jgi:hypothetical protein